MLVGYGPQDGDFRPQEIPVGDAIVTAVIPRLREDVQGNAQVVQPLLVPG